MCVTSRTSSSSDIFSSSPPVRARSPSPRIPISRATAIAVSLWSPVIITTRIPAFLQRRIASIASDRGASIIPASPRKVRSVSRVSSFSGGTSPRNSDGKSDDPEGPRRQLLIPEQVLSPIVFGERLPLAVHHVVGTSRENPFRCALHVQDGGHALEAP